MHLEVKLGVEGWIEMKKEKKKKTQLTDSF
jgi:hypothetical protein